MKFFACWFFLGISTSSISLSSFASVADIVEDYGLLPEYRSLTISPGGNYYACIQRIKNNDYFVVLNAETGELVRRVNASKFKARSIGFATEKHVILRASETVRFARHWGKWESGYALTFNIETGELKYLLNGFENLHLGQTSFDAIVGLNAEDEKAYILGYGKNGALNIYEANLDGGKGRMYQKGRRETIDWFLSKKGDVLARIDYLEKEGEFLIYSRQSGSWRKVYSEKASRLEIAAIAVSSDTKNIFIVAGDDSLSYIKKVNIETGVVSEPLFKRSDKDIEDIVTDHNRQLLAIKYSGFKSEYQFLNNGDNQAFERLNLAFPMSDVSYRGTTDDKKKVIYRVSGSDGAGIYGVFDAETGQAKSLLGEYPQVKQVAELKAVSYKARDGLKIPAILTFPLNKISRKNLPLIVMPHGGPESYDGLKFDWMAQYFARLGYAVLQPNFRGSTGFGSDFTKAGHGKWGREMQDDVTDGVNAMVKMGYVDPERVCIVGASYGGYSALAGGAFSPELYSCVVAIAGVSDLPEMLRSEKREYGKDHWVVSYWEKLIGNSKTEREKLKAISPVNFAKRFQAPVMLLHGKDDTVVPIKQSKLMARALKKAKKPVKLVTLRGEDHWLSNSKTRLELLKQISIFLGTHNPP